LLKLVRKLFIVGYQVRDIDVAVILLDEYILANLVSVKKDIVEVEVHDKVDQLLLDPRWGGAILALIARLAAEDAD
jgi:hypothetical protein